MTVRVLVRAMPETLSGLSPAFQLVVLALAALFIAAGLAKKYFKDQVTEAVKAQPIMGQHAAPIIFDERTIAELVRSLDRLDATLCRESADNDRIIAAITENTSAVRKSTLALRATSAMPPSEEMLILLRKLAQANGVVFDDD